jgi:hypothetical protein
MTPEQGEAERFEDIVRNETNGHLDRDDDGKYIDCEVRDAWFFWRKRAEIAIAERTELNAEIERLRERVRELAELHLIHGLRGIRKGSATNSLWWWRTSNNPGPFGLRALAESAECWLDDDFKKVPLVEWKARAGE